MLSGLNQWASDFVESAQARKRFYRRDADTRVSLHRYDFPRPDGRKYFEFVQGTTTTNAGVIVFLALKDEVGAVSGNSLWSERAMK